AARSSGDGDRDSIPGRYRTAVRCARGRPEPGRGGRPHAPAGSGRYCRHCPVARCHCRCCRSGWSGPAPYCTLPVAGTAGYVKAAWACPKWAWGYDTACRRECHARFATIFFGAGCVRVAWHNIRGGTGQGAPEPSMLSQRTVAGGCAATVQMVCLPRRMKRGSQMKFNRRVSGADGLGDRLGGGRSRTLGTVIGALLIVYLLICLLVGWYWSREPGLNELNVLPVGASNSLTTGSHTARTVRALSMTLLEKPGGFISNDITPPGIWLDNMPSWEFGVLVQVRDMARAMRRDMARSQSQSTEDAALAKAEPPPHFRSGSHTARTVRALSMTLLEKPGGFISNDITPPGIWLDNMPSWEFGVLVQVRDMARAMRRDMARSQSQSTEDAALAKAEPLLHF